MTRPPLLPCRLVLTCLCLTLLGACAVTSTPIQHLQISAGEITSGSSDSPVIVLDAVKLPDFLLRDELLLRQDEYTLRYIPFQRWAEPLDLGIQRALGQHLASLLDTRQLVRFPEVPRTEADWHLEVEVRHFEVVGGQALLAAEGRWSRAESPGVISNIIDFEEVATVDSQSGSDIAATLSKLLGRFSEALAEPIRQQQQLSSTKPI